MPQITAPLGFFPTHAERSEKFRVEKLITYYYNQLYGIRQIVFDATGQW